MNIPKVIEIKAQGVRKVLTCIIIEVLLFIICLKVIEVVKAEPIYTVGAMVLVAGGFFNFNAKEYTSPDLKLKGGSDNG